VGNNTTVEEGVQMMTIRYYKGFESSFFSGTERQVRRERKRLLKLKYEVEFVDNKEAETIGNTEDLTKFLKK
jgi:hypothetical protein